MLLAWMAIVLVVYTSTYYLWGRYLVHGILPYDLHRQLKPGHTKLRGLYRYRGSGESPESHEPQKSENGR
jgi:hypothetical protein